MDPIACTSADVINPGDVLRNLWPWMGEIVKVSKNDNFFLLFFYFEKKMACLNFVLNYTMYTLLHICSNEMN